ncbi:hopanoid biosynthesis associated protein HpnK [Afipia felis]|uniref:Hopanoid biosynthesis associated protein HpnK n=1 Tax=Afipia felis TaxID=1035 RepID=A0A090MT82_AFIFE|nr:MULTISPECIES: ChbG/HpnK family deacetylase [Afipia]EFI51151.1 YdjC family protein [Afipia sp. 1NLS2]CEG09367.1 hopanoid biosynthesis associated protein HpnK [Afipia felis]
MSGTRRITLCADDYGISEGVNRAIRDLIERRRLNATSVMVVAPAATREEAEALSRVAAEGCEIGLHVTLTAPFSPLTMHFRPLDGGMFWPVNKLLRMALLRRLDSEFVYAEVMAQIALFRELFGTPPAYLDGHQHVQLFPGIREGFIRAARDAAPEAWVRQCGRTHTSMQLGNPKAMLLDGLSATFRRRCAASGLRTNPAFAGAYDFRTLPDFGNLMRGFLSTLPDGGLVMCHPGFVDETLRALDPLTDQREREHAYLASDDFPRLLDELGISLAKA